MKIFIGDARKDGMMRTIVLPVALLLAACSQGEAPASDAAGESAARFPEAPPSQESAPGQAAAPTRVVPPQSTVPPTGYVAVDMSSTDSMPQCRAGLKARGLNEAELEIMLGPMAGVCPNNGVSEGRIREILTTIWTQAGCHQHGPIEVAKALDSGACGGDAG